VNAARGATVVAADDLLDSRGQAQMVCILNGVAGALERLPEAEFILEMGVDLVLDKSGSPVLIEINGRPRGRLAVLAATQPKRFAEAHRRAVMRPFQRITSVL